MDLSLSEQQEMLRTTARDFLTKECPKDLVRKMLKDEKGYSVDLWKKMTDAGWMGLIIPEKYGGMGATFLDLVVLLQEMGRVCLPGPYFSNLVGALVILEGGNEIQKQEFLPRIAEGGLLLTLALCEQGTGYDLNFIKSQAIQKRDEYIIDGTKLFVENGHIADFLITIVTVKSGTTTRSKNIIPLLVGAKSTGITSTLLNILGGDKYCEVLFNNVRCPSHNLLGEPRLGTSHIEAVLRKSAVAKCAEMLGGAEMAFELSVQYAKERVQFGMPIGGFQSIQFYCAEMKIDLEAMRNLVFHAAWKISEGLPYAKESAMAKFWMNKTYRQLTLLAHQIHGAIGFTEDHELPLYYLRSKAGEFAFGDNRYQADLIAAEMGLGAGRAIR